jgi:phosphate transport system substrate-binding protein
VKRTVPVVLLAGTLALAACGSSGSKTSNPTTGATTSAGGGGSSSLTESGSSLMYPYLEAIAPTFHAANPSISVQTAAGGSGKGISDAAGGTTDFGASDAYLSASEMAEYPTLLDISVVVSSQAVDYNLAGIKNLKLSGAVLAEIYQGKITMWNDPAITKLNPGVTLPAETIHPIHREDSSGDSFLFTSFLTKTSPTWASTVGESTLPAWPSVSASASATGNPGMVQSCSSTKGCIAYVGISAQSTATAAGLGEAELENASGAFLQSDPATVDAAVAASIASVPSDLAASLIYAKGADAYPIVNFEYIIVKKGAAKAAAIQKFLSYIISTSGGSAPAALAKQDFEALPSALVPKVQAAIASI